MLETLINLQCCLRKDITYYARKEDQEQATSQDGEGSGEGSTLEGTFVLNYNTISALIAPSLVSCFQKYVPFAMHILQETRSERWL